MGFTVLSAVGGGLGFNALVGGGDEEEKMRGGGKRRER